MAAVAPVHYPIAAADPLAAMKVAMARVLRDVVGLNENTYQCQYLLTYAGESLMVPAQTTTVSLARIKTIVDDFNRIYGRANVQLIIGLNQQLNLEAFVYKFHQLEFENVDLANFNPLTIVDATLEQAKVGIRRIKATRSAHATSPQLMKTPYAEAAAFLSWLADARRVACTRVGQFEQTIDYLLDPNNSAPRGSKFDQDNTELFNILAPSFMNSSDSTMTRLILPYQASSDGLALFKHVLELNQGEAGLN